MQFFFAYDIPLTGVFRALEVLEDLGYVYHLKLPLILTEVVKYIF